jgi:small subunit ribosomal protein S3Ae
LKTITFINIYLIPNNMVEKIKKKKFVKIISPKQFNENIIGESIVADPRLLIGRRITANMMSLTDNPKNQNIQIKFKITELKGESVKTEMVGYTLLPAFVRRLVRKEKDRVDDCFKAKTSDNKNLKIKIFHLTLNKTTKSVLTALRKSTQDSIKNTVSKMSYDALMNDIISHKLQNGLRKELAKIYPLKQCEIRSIEIVEKSKNNKEKEITLKIESDEKIDVSKEEIKPEETVSDDLEKESEVKEN